MSHSESSWRTEIRAHKPQTCDYVEFGTFGGELLEWRAELIDDGFKDDLEYWDQLIGELHLAVPLEQCCDDGMLVEKQEVESRLEQCPEEQRGWTLEFLENAGRPVREYLAFFYFGLVQTERQRRCGTSEWRSEAASGSPEVLRELMFKWGPRFKRHRWTW